MIDYYYEFAPDTQWKGQPIRYGFQRGLHPDNSEESLRHLHNHFYQWSTRVWIENANGMTLIRRQGRDVHERINHGEVTWIKLQAQELEV